MPPSPYSKGQGNKFLNLGTMGCGPVWVDNNYIKLLLHE